MAFNISVTFNNFMGTPGMIRDVSHTFVRNTGMTVSMVKRYKAAGLDWAIYNRGLAPITISIDGEPVDTIPAGGFLNANDIKYDRIVTTATDNYTLYVAGATLR